MSLSCQDGALNWSCPLCRSLWHDFRVADRIVLVNGLPGSGKTMLAASLAPTLPASLISKDAIKEAIADAVAAVPAHLLGPAVGEMMWSFAAGMSGTVLLESWWFRPRDLAFVETGLRRCGLPTVVEVWCEVPAQVAQDRFVARRRHPVHGDQRRLDESWPRWVVEAEPLGVGRTVLVRTDRPVDIADVTRRVAAALA
jgi:predicted kinase